MTQFPPGSTNPPAVPPQAPYGGDFGVGPEPKSWPKVIGIISIVYGSLGLICNSCISSSPVAMPLLGDFMKQSVVQEAKSRGETIDPATVSLPPMFQFDPFAVAVGVLGLICSVLLITAGAMLVRRSPRGRTLHLVWIGGTLLVLALTIMHAIQLHGRLTDWVAKNPGNPLSSQFSPAGTLIQSIISLAVRLVYPIFILIWFLVVKRDTREITEGAAENPV